MLFTEYNEEVHIKNEKEISYKDGYDNGINIMSQLYAKLEELNRIEEYSRAVKGPEFRNKVIQELIP